METQKNALALFLILLIFSFSFCKKEPKPDEPKALIAGHTPPPCVPTVSPLTDPILIDCKYKPGSYWIFTDSLSGNVDTLVVENLKRSPYLVSSYSCDTLEDFTVKLKFKNESIPAFKAIDFYISKDKNNVMFSDTYLWERSSQSSRIVMYGTGAKMQDSLQMDGTTYKNVGETGALEFLQNDPNRMEPQSLKLFFNSEFGPLRFDFHDRLTGALTGRRKVVGRVVVR